MVVVVVRLTRGRSVFPLIAGSRFRTFSVVVPTTNGSARYTSSQ